MGNGFTHKSSHRERGEIAENLAKLKAKHMGRQLERATETHAMRRGRREGRKGCLRAAGGGEGSGVNIKREKNEKEGEQGRIHDCSCRGRFGRGSNDLGRGSNDLGRGMLKYKLYNS